MTDGHKPSLFRKRPYHLLGCNNGPIAAPRYPPPVEDEAA
jgi:hypothetical protein